MRSRRWRFDSSCLTRVLLDLLQGYPCKYLIYSYTGLHEVISGYMVTLDATTDSFLAKRFPGLEFSLIEIPEPFSIVVSSFKRLSFCSNLVERGEIPISGSRKDLIIPTDLTQKGISSGFQSYWFYGAPGTGKKTAVLSRFPDAYLKTNDKWFSGYDDDEVILLPDFTRFTCCGRYLKIWGGHHRSIGELSCKPYRVDLKHRYFFVTSDYHPKEYFLDTALESIVNRFRFYEFKKDGVKPPLPSDF